jgi:hypothetical protein
MLGALMAVWIASIEDAGDFPDGGAILVDSVSMRAFGPIFKDWDDAQDFYEWVTRDRTTDPREFSDAQLDVVLRLWRQSR